MAPNCNLQNFKIQHNPKNEIIEISRSYNFPNFILEARFIFWHVLVYRFRVDCIFQTYLIIFFFEKDLQFSRRAEIVNFTAWN